MKDLTLVIMAAGMGSRFGGLKQIEPVGPNGEIIADYSVYDAINAGFTKVVFIIRREHLDYFKEHITSKFEDKIKVEFAFQELDMIPNDVTLPEGREKMLGTGHAILCAKDKVDGNFAVINADDFYGANSYKDVKRFFDNSEDEHEYVNIAYPYIETASKNGKVKRGVIVLEDGYAKDALESEIGEEDGKIVATTLTGGKVFEIEPTQPVSMNFFGFKHNVFDLLEKHFDPFIHGELGLKDEFLLPEIIKKGIENDELKLKCETTTSKWMGVTYREDLDEVKAKIVELIEKGDYPNNLWS